MPTEKNEELNSNENLDLIQEKPENEKKIPKNANQKKYSNWFITINPNVKMDKGHPQFKNFYKTFKKSLDDLFSKENIRNYIVIKKKNDTFNKIKQITCNYTTEYGDTLNLLHGHALVEIRHYTCIKLNYDSIRKHIKESLSPEYVLKNNEIHLDVQVIRSTNRQTILDYINKKKL
jgi:hypothetical protein